MFTCWKLVNTMEILATMRGTVKTIIGPRWCQNHDYARSEVPFIMVDKYKKKTKTKKTTQLKTIKKI